LQRALAALQAGNLKDAERLFKAVLRGQPRHLAALNLLGIVLTRSGRFAEAEKYLKLALRENARSDATLSNYGIVLKALNRPAEALAQFTQALAINAAAAETWTSRGIVLNDLQRFDEAGADFDRAIALNPRSVDAHFNKAKSLLGLDRLEAAIAACEKALALKPDLAEAWFTYGNTLCALERRNEGIAAYDKALAVAPNWAAAHCNRGAALLDLKRFAEAAESSNRAIGLAADVTAAHRNLAGALIGLNRCSEALASCDRAIALNSSEVETWLMRGEALSGLRWYDEALAAYERVLALRPDRAEAWLGCGRIHSERGEYERASAACDRALALKPDLDHAASARLAARLYTCTWTGLDTEVAQFVALIRDDCVSNLPFAALTVASSPADQLQCAKRYVDDLPKVAPLWRGEVYAHDRVRVAYVSADFCDHPVAQMIIGLLEHHDKSRFETIGISFGTDETSPMRQRIEGALDHFAQVRDHSDRDIAELIRRREIDIAVDLMGYTKDSRPGILASRPAPLQVNYLGYPATMGASFIDYIIADSTIVPPEQCDFYSERVVWLPDTYQVNDRRRPIAEPGPDRRQCGLPDSGFVFCCFNNSYKILPKIFEVWTRLLTAIDGSVLWLKDSGPAVASNLRREAERSGIAPERLVFAPRAPLMADHLARYRQADLFLDTLPYNAHTTASDALWAGLPVLTCLGETFAGRVAGSVLKSAGIEELIAGSLAEYEALALRCARDPAFLASIRAKVAQNRDSCALFDTARATRQFEAAYTMMIDRLRRGDAPNASTQQREPIKIT
jgi:protein O-GlcNAc transferase